MDTHTLLWLAENSPKLSSTTNAIVNDLSNRAFYSIVSLWEIAIKVGRTFFGSVFFFLTEREP